MALCAIAERRRPGRRGGAGVRDASIGRCHGPLL